MARRKDPVARFERLFRKLRQDPPSIQVVARSKLRLLLAFTDPDGSLAVNGRTNPFEVERDPAGFTADLTLTMSCETADRFFRGTLDLTRALAARDIVSRGSLLRMLELRSLLERAREVYRQTP